MSGGRGDDMDFEQFDNDAEETTDEEYFAFVKWLEAKTAEAFRRAKGDPEAEKQELIAYYKRGYRANLTPSELIDFLAVDANNILEMAGYSDEEAIALMEVSDHLTDEELNS
jgi:hypothetical protein